MVEIAGGKHAEVEDRQTAANQPLPHQLVGLPDHPHAADQHTHASQDA